MKQVTTYVGIDAHKKDLFIAMLIGTEPKPVTWQLAHAPQEVRRLVQKLEREALGPVRYRRARLRVGLPDGASQQAPGVDPGEWRCRPGPARVH
jgi:hypothetical protein